MKYLCVLLTLIAAGPASASDVSWFTPGVRGAVFDGTIRNLGDYVDKRLAEKAIGALNAERAADLQIGDPEGFAARLTATMQSVTRDKHLVVDYDPDIAPEQHAPTPADIAERKAVFEARSGGILSVRNMYGNIGFLQLGGAPPIEYAKKEIDAAMTLLTHTDALIIDLRHHAGGDGRTVAYLLSYLVGPGKPLEETHWASPAKIDKSATAAVAGPLFVGKPVYVLTSGDTISAGGALAYDIQSLHRGAVIGAGTAGAANPGDIRRIQEHFSIFVPVARVVNPYTRSNWEGTGVKPDVEVDPGQALIEAYTRALTEAKTAIPSVARMRAQAQKDPKRFLDVMFSL
jgi:hypothetical protein